MTRRGFAALHLDVTESSGATLLASDDTYKGTPASGGGWNWANALGASVPRVVPFTVTDPCAQNVEFRVQAFQGFQAGSIEYIQGVYSVRLDPR